MRRLANFQNDIRELSIQMRISYTHVPREKNEMADKLDNWGDWGFFNAHRD